jgi:hypothetical protein
MKKRLFSIGFLLSLLFSLNAAEVWVSPSGNDGNPGTKLLPKATLQAAMRQARELRRLNDASINGGIHVILRGGRYAMTETLLLTPEDSGSPESPTIVEAAVGEIPVLSGAVSVPNWQRLKQPIVGLRKNLNVWVADVPEFAGHLVDFRQVWVNGIKVPVASNTTCDKMMRILGVDAKNKTIRIPALTLKNVVNPSGMELFIHQMWETAVLRIASFEFKGDEAILHFFEPEATIEFDHPWPPPVVSKKGNSAFILKRAPEFLDTPGEWYHDRTSGKLYYIPKEGEDMLKAEVLVPAIETLVQVEGTAERPMHDVHFKGITFAHSTWLRPSRMGDVPLQAGMYILDAYKLKVPGTPDKATLENQAWVGRPPAAVMLHNVHHTAFEDCTFEHVGAAGLDYLYGSNQDRVNGCHFKDIAGNGLVVGKFSDPGVEAHLPYDPTDQRELTQNMLISNNLIEDAANEYWGCCGILAGFVRGVTIEHNELRDLSYTGISVGWGWTRTINCMRNNTIHANLVHEFGKHNYSCGGIYTLSAQPGTIISENCIYDVPTIDYAHDSTDFRIYLDEASSYMVVKNNWTDKAKFGFNQTGLIQFENNGPQVSKEIKDKAGLEKEYTLK